MSADLPKTAVLSLEIVRNQSPKDKAVGMDLAKAYGAAGMGAKADAVLDELRRFYPTDGELNTLQKHLSATRTMNEGGYNSLADGKGSFRDILKDKKEAVSLEQQSRSVKDENASANLIKQFETQLAAEPGNIKVIRDLGDLYAQQKNYDKALEYYQRITAEGGVIDAATEKIISDLQIKRIDHALSQVDPQAPDAAAQIERIKGERAAFVLSDAKRRAEKYPNDLVIKFEVGVLYFQMGQIGEAIQEFQKSQSNQHKRIQSMNYLAQCFAARNMNDMAARKLQEAIKEKPNFDDEKKDLTYNLGCVYEKMGKAQEAVMQFEQIYQEDISYRDVEAKVNNFYNSGGTTTPPPTPPAS
jgi:tetratricopeptide (TPR) repeat protein